MDSKLFHEITVAALRSLNIKTINKKVFDTYEFDISKKDSDKKITINLPALIVHHDKFMSSSDQADSETVLYIFAEGNSRKQAHKNCLIVLSEIEKKLVEIQSTIEYQSYLVFLKGVKSYLFKSIEIEPMDEETIFCFVAEVDITIKEK